MKNILRFGICLLAMGIAMPVNAQSQLLQRSDSTIKTSQNSSDNASSDEDDKPKRLRYFGLGGTVGFRDSGDTSLGNGGFSLVGRFPISDVLSVHTASVLGNDSITSAALTGGVPIRQKNSEKIRLFPFLGVGAVAEISDFNIDPLVTGGVDIPITEKITGTARINASFTGDGTDVGGVLGVGIRLF